MSVLGKQGKSAGWRLVVASALVSLSCFVVLLPLTAYWGANDDVRMSMLAGGFGIAQSSTPLLLHSNVLWGLLAQYFPALPGMTGYGFLAYCLIALVLMALAYCLLRMDIPVAAAWLLIMLPGASALVYPQYTKSAGLAVVAGVGLLLLYEKYRERSLLVIAALLALTGYLVRDLAALMVLLLAIPFVPYSLARDRFAVACAALVVIAAVSVTFVDRQFYSGEAWDSYLALNSVRARFTDHGATELAVAQPELLREHGFSKSDIYLVGNWFFVDRSLADPIRLQAILDNLPSQTHGLAAALAGPGVLLLGFLLPVLAACILVLVLKPGWRVGAAWGLFILVLVASAFQGRPFPARVLLPVYALLLLVPVLLQAWPRRKLKHPAVYAALFACNLLHVGFLWQGQQNMDDEAVVLQEVAAEMEKEDTAVWGQILFVDNLYRPFDSGDRELRYYEVAEMTHVPASRATYLEQQGEGFVERLLSEQGVRLLTRDIYLPLLAAYCAEHHDGQLVRLAQHYRYETRGVVGELNSLRCTPVQ